MDRQAEALRAAARVMRARNGRLAVNWISRAQKPRWRMLPLDSTWYDRDRLRALAAARAVVPSTSRPLTPMERRAINDRNPWRLYDKRRQ